MITDQPHTADIASTNGKAHQADIAGSAAEHDEIKIPPFLERKYNLEILRRSSEWPWEAIAALGTREPIVIEPEPFEGTAAGIGRGRVVPVAVPVARSWRRDAAMVAVGTLLGGIIVGVFALGGRGLPGEPNVNSGVPTTTVPVVAVVASTTATEVAPTVAIVVPTDTAVVVVTNTVEPTATAEIVVLPTDTVAEIPTDTPPEPTEVVAPTRVPVRPTNTRVVPVATATEAEVATATPVLAEPTATIEVVPTEVEGTVAPVETATSEPTAVVTVGPIESPTPLPGIVTPTVEPISTPTEPSGPPTPLPGILTPTPEGQ